MMVQYIKAHACMLDLSTSQKARILSYRFASQDFSIMLPTQRKKSWFESGCSDLEEKPWIYSIKCSEASISLAMSKCN
jgi:hypothetical protein